MQIEALSQGEINILRPHTTAPEQIKRERHPVNIGVAHQMGDTKVAPEEVLKRISALTDGGAHSVHFEMDQDLNMLVVKVYNTSTNELIRQIPAESLLETAKALNEYRRGLIVDDKS